MTSKRDPDPAGLLRRIAAGRTDLVLAWVEAGGSPIANDGDGVSILQWCAYYGDVSAVRFLQAHGAGLESLGPNLDLQGAAFHGHWRLCEFLLESAADPNFADPHTGETPLHAALCTANRPAHDLVVQVLLAAGANPAAVTVPGVPTGSFMRDARTRGETPLHRAAAFAGPETIQRLLAAGARLEAMDAHGDTPLAWASWHTRPDAVLRLLCYGEHRIHPERNSTFDHGNGWRVLDSALLGKPVPPDAGEPGKP